MDRRYEQRKLAGECTRCGVPSPDDLLCPGCRAGARARTAASTKRMRDGRRAKGQCVRCGKASDKYRCTACLVALGQGPRPSVNHSVNHRSIHTARRRDVTEADGRTRHRFIGQGKRGKIPNAVNDEQDAKLVQRELERAVAGLAYAHSAEVKALPRIQAKDILHAALSRLHLVQRLLGDILRRHRYGAGQRDS